MNACAECGADQPNGASCRECFDALLAYENERPDVFFAVHHLTVATYFLQHPSGYPVATLDAWRGLIAESLDGGLPSREFLKRMGQQFAGGRKARDANAKVPDDWPRAWTTTVRDVLDPRAELPTAEEYVARARVWADSVKQALGVRR